MSVIQYAAYGSNLHPIRLTKRVPSAELLGTSVLPGWSVRFHKLSNLDGSGKCNIVNYGAGIHLAIYRISLSEKALLDKYEGLGKGYNETLIDVPCYGECFTYIASDRHIRDNLVPLDWYKDMVVVGCEANDFPIDYIERIRSTPASADSNHKRSLEQWKIVEQLRNGT